MESDNMKITNYQALILLELENTNKENGIWRPDLAEILKTPLTTLFDNLKKLSLPEFQKELVERYEINDGKKGRNKVLWYATDLGKRAIIVLKRGMT
jgi:hypothetical protein